MQLNAILVEDEAPLRLATTQTLELGGFTVTACDSAEAAQALIEADFDGVIVSDVRLPGRSGLDLLAHVAALDAELPVIMVTGHGDVAMAVGAMRSGAYDFIEKPFGAERLLDAVRRAQDKRRLVLENRRLKTAWALHPDTPQLIGHSPAMERLKVLIRNIAPAGVRHPDQRRHGHRQGSGRAADPRGQRAQGQFRRHQLRCPARIGVRKRDVRPRSGRVHGRAETPHRQARIRERRYAVPRRDREHADGAASETAARAAGTQPGAPGRQRRHCRQFPHHRGQQGRSAGAERPGPVPRRPVLPHRGRDAGPAAPS